MQFFMNGQIFDITFEGNETVATIFEGIDKWCENNELIINSITINEENIFHAADGQIIDKFGDKKDSIERVDIEAISYFEYAYNSFVEIVAYLKNLATTEINESINIDDIINGSNMIIDSIPRTTFLLGTALDNNNIVSDIHILKARIERLAEIKDDKTAALSFFKDDIQEFLSNTFLKTLTDIFDDIEINLLISLSNNISSSNALYRIGVLKSFVSSLGENIDDIVSFIQTGDDRKGFLKLEKFLSSTQVACSIISKSLDVYEIEGDSISYNGAMFSELIEEFNANMNDILEAFNNSDFVSVADILEYEVKDKIASLADFIAIIENTIGLKIVAS